MNYVRSWGVRGRSRSRMKVTWLLMLWFNYQLIFSLLGGSAVWYNVPYESSKAGSCPSSSFAGDFFKPSSAAAPGLAEGPHRTRSPAKAVAAAGDECPEQRGWAASETAAALFILQTASFLSTAALGTQGTAEFIINWVKERTIAGGDPGL